jgi:hypothetical protein
VLMTRQLETSPKLQDDRDHELALEDRICGIYLDKSALDAMVVSLICSTRYEIALWRI